MKKEKNLEIILSVFIAIFIVVITILGQTNVMNKTLSGNIVNITVTSFFIYQGIVFLKKKRKAEAMLCFLYVLASILFYFI